MIPHKQPTHTALYILILIPHQPPVLKPTPSPSPSPPLPQTSLIPRSTHYTRPLPVYLIFFNQTLPPSFPAFYTLTHPTPTLKLTKAINKALRTTHYTLQESQSD